MSYETILFGAYLGFVILVGGGAIVWVFWRRLTRRDEVWRSLNLRLLHVALPRPGTPDKAPTLAETRDAIGIMEKVYASLQAVRESPWRSFIYGKPSFSLEITVPHTGEEILLYVAVPRRLAFSVEKIIEGAFPEARVEETNDYNIFHPDGHAAAALVTLKRNAAFPLRTYRTLENDPLGEVTNVFSKLARVGEGAAIQIVARPAARHWAGNFTDYAKRVYQGKAALSSRGAIREELMKLGDFRESEQKKQGEEKIQEHRLSPAEEEQVRAIEGKASHPLFEASIRLVASAATEARAQEILQSISAPFHQFRNPSLNELDVKLLRGRQLRKALYRFSFRVLDEHALSVFSSEELTSFFHFPNVSIETPKLKTVKAREAPPPVNLPETGLRIGMSVFRGETRDVNITDDDRRRHLYLIGQTGTGKSALLTEMIRQDILAGRGLCFIDPHGQSVEEVLGYVPESRARDVIYFNPGDVERPLGLNMLEFDPRFPEQKTLVVNELFSIFQKLYGAVPEALGPMFEQYFRNSTLLVMDDPASGSTLLEIERVFADKAFRDLKLSRSTNVVVQTFWREIAEKAGGEASLANMVPYITSKFDTFLANEIMRPIIAQERSAFNFRDVMDQKKILLVNLSKGRLGEINASLIGLIVVGKILLAALSRSDVPESERPDFYLYLDEFQNITTRSIATILSEARKYRLSMTLAHQFLGQLDEEIKKAVFGNVGSMVAFRIGSDDAEFMTSQFQPVFSAEDLLNIDNYHAYVKLLIRGQTSQPFNMKTYPPAPAALENAERVKTLSRLTYGRLRSEVEAEVQARYQGKTG